MRDADDGYDYLCTHVDGFKILAKDPSVWMNVIKERFLARRCPVLIYYLGNNFRFETEENLWKYDCNTYCGEAVRKCESIFGDLKSRKTPLPTNDCHPEMDESPLLPLKDYCHYQQLLGIGIWLVVVEHPDICFAIASMGRFGASPR